VAQALAEAYSEPQLLPKHRFNAVLKLERRGRHDGLVAVGGNYYGVPDRKRRVVEIERLSDLYPYYQTRHRRCNFSIISDSNVEAARRGAAPSDGLFKHDDPGGDTRSLAA